MNIDHSVSGIFDERKKERETKCKTHIAEDCDLTREKPQNHCPNGAELNASEAKLIT